MYTYLSSWVIYPPLSQVEWRTDNRPQSSVFVLMCQLSSTFLPLCFPNSLVSDCVTSVSHIWPFRDLFCSCILSLWLLSLLSSSSSLQHEQLLIWAPFTTHVRGMLFQVSMHKKTQWFVYATGLERFLWSILQSFVIVDHCTRRFSIWEKQQKPQEKNFEVTFLPRQKMLLSKWAMIVLYRSHPFKMVSLKVVLRVYTSKCVALFGCC